MRLISTIVAVSVAALTTAPSLEAQGPGDRYARRWVYAPQNLLVDKNVDEVIELIGRSSGAGYNGLMLADYKFNILDRMPERYFRNAARVREAAAKAHLEIIPAIFPIGYSDGLLAHDPNLAEGLPVDDAPFRVRGRELVPVVDPASVIRNGDLEEARGDAFLRFSFQDDPGKATFSDPDVAHHGRRSCRIQDVGRTSSHGNARLIQRVKVRPHACYRFSCWAKTQGLSNPEAFHLTVLGAGDGGRQLTFHEGGVQGTMDWKPVEVVFNSLDQVEVNLYAGIWGGGSGTLWLDELALVELSLVNVLRREGCPLVVSAADSGTTYEEGRDYEPVRDPKLGRVPYEGLYHFGHEGATLRRTPASRIKDGEALKVSWYHPILTHGEQMMCCPSEPKVYELLRDQAKRVNDLFRPTTFFMSHDEIRVMNWCRACRQRKLTPGAILAENVRRCVRILKEMRPDAKVAVWSDMFDPDHNAVDHYYLVNGTLRGSWEGLSPDVLIANWNGGKAAESLRWFAGRGHSQILAGYYDVDDLSNFRRWDEAARNIKGVEGFMYTTWQQKYQMLEPYGDALKARR